MPKIYRNSLSDDDQIYLKVTGLPKIDTATITNASGQSSFAFIYTVGLIDVKLNWKRLKPSEYTATNGTTVVLATPLTSNSDVLVLDAYQSARYATTLEPGLVSLSTDTEAQLKTGETVITSGNLAALNATPEMAGFVEKATTAEAMAGATDKFPDAAGVKSYVDQFGIGVTSLSAVADLNSLTASGIYRSNNTTANRPAGMDYTTVTHSVRSSGEMTQAAVNLTGVTRVAVRCKVAGAWVDWEYLNPTVGTVSQSGGIPTGAIIESGSNANGYYIKYADGTMICRHYASSTEAIATSNNVFGYITASTITWTYPVAFIAEPSVLGAGDGVTCSVAILTISSSSAAYVVTSVNVSSSSHRARSLFAIGRWY
jgi:hypothetical protein